MRYRVTIRGPGTELRGYAAPEALAALAKDSADPFVVIASPALETYDPFEPLCTRGMVLKYHTEPCEPGCNYPARRETP